MSTIFTRSCIADAVGAARLDDVEHGTDRAIHLVASMSHLTCEAVGHIAAEETLCAARAEAHGAMERARGELGNTDAAIQAASTATGIPADVLCQLAAEEADPRLFDLVELSGVAARSLGITTDLANAPPSRCCGACQRNCAAMEA